MTTREERIEAEAADLWRELYDEPPPAMDDPGDMLELMLSRLPTVDYDRLASAGLRRGGLSFPKRGTAAPR
jgi:hypothetical protein